ncbi:hypothetical protein H7J06_23920 [Mycobacterium hodleri]|uniref:hypothetical protein n=1 Tax=Mycolicibacterium hodleri TaxID=49897 RepID=UPI0021F2A379|nr:hypothetical protein [Mycolicibacterium hodleri]MCV7136024.1 hypothetical protein [Mycolicibacterium hodleri]
MPTETRPGTDSLLDHVDQALFLGLRATGQSAAMQMVWVYEDAPNWDELRRSHQDFGFGLAGRLIEPSVLPFGRHRWVSSLGPAAPLDVAVTPRPRAELSDWIDERAQLPIDPEHGPAWHMAVQPLTDGSTAVTLVGSHCIGDGGAAFLSVFEAVMGARRDLGYPLPRSRTRRQALLADTRQTVRDLPELGRTLVAAAKFLRAKRKTSDAPPSAPKRAAVSRPGETVIVPAISAFVDLAKWDARAEALGGNGHSLQAGLAARLAVHQGRALAADGTVGLIVPINDRTLEDTRANAVKLAYVRVDPTHVAKDLTDTRTAVREALKVMREKPDEALALLPLNPFVPKVAVRHSADLAFGFTDQPVSSSNVGDLPIQVASPGGAPAQQVMLRGIDQRITRGVLEERSGLLTVVSGRLNGKVTITVVGYQPGAENTKQALRDRLAAVFEEFELTAVIV